MDCHECQELIQCCLDGDPPSLDRADFAAHLSICLHCRDRHAAAQSLLDGLRLLAPPRLPAGLLERTCQQIVVERGRAARFRRRLVSAAVAASLLLTCCAVYLASRAGSDGETLPQLTRQQQPVGPAVLPSLHRRIEEAGLAVVTLTRRTADETMSQTKLLLPESIPHTSIGDPQELKQALEPPAQSLREIQQGMSAGLEPVATSARRAVGFFLGRIPPVATEQRSKS